MKEFELNFCGKCFQMTNHLDGLCQKCTTRNIPYILPVDYTKLSRQERREVREQYIAEQDGKCYYCLGNLRLSPPDYITEKKINWYLFPTNFLDHPIHLQHNHDTNMTEGAVHAYCNAVLWEYEGR